MSDPAPIRLAPVDDDPMVRAAGRLVTGLGVDNRVQLAIPVHDAAD